MEISSGASISSMTLAEFAKYDLGLVCLALGMSLFGFGFICGVKAEVSKRRREDDIKRLDAAIERVLEEKLKIRATFER